MDNTYSQQSGYFPFLDDIDSAFNERLLDMHLFRSGVGRYPRNISRLNDKGSFRSDQKLFSNADQIDALNNLINQARFAEAQVLARKITARYPLLGYAWHALGAILLHQGQLDEALQHLKTAIVLLPSDAEAYNNHGCALERLGRMQEAELSYQYAISIKPDFAQAHHNLGVVQRAQGRCTESLASLEQAIQIMPDYANAYYNLGLTLVRLNRLEEALTDFQIALKIKPDHPYAKTALNIVQSHTAAA